MVKKKARAKKGNAKVAAARELLEEDGELYENLNAIDELEDQLNESQDNLNEIDSEHGDNSKESA